METNAFDAYSSALKGQTLALQRRENGVCCGVGRVEFSCVELGRILAADIMGKGPESESYSDGVLVPCGVTELVSQRKQLCNGDM